MNWIDHDNLDELSRIRDFLYFICYLGIESASDTLHTLDKEITDNFCLDCGTLENECKCDDHWDHWKYGGRYMREYDDGADYED